MQNQTDEKAKWIEQAVRKYEGQLIRYTTRLIGNLEKAKEIVQEAFLKLWKVNKRKVEGCLAPWLFKVCRNRSIDILRKEKKMELIDDEQILEDCSHKDPAETLHRAGQLRSVKDAMKFLSKKQQEVLVLKFQNNLSYKEISEIAGISVSNVGFLIHEGVQNLRKHFSDAKEVI